MGLSKLHLCGHSLGGFLASAYALRHPDRLQSLILASPAGIPHYDAATSAAMRKARVERASWMGRIFFWLAETSWINSLSPQDLVRGLGPSGAWLVRKAISGRFRHVADLNATALSEYVYHTFVHDKSGELAFLRLFNPIPLSSKRPLMSRVAQFPRSVPTLTLFGADDWMASEQALQFGKQVGQLSILPKCGHQLYLENPAAFNAALLAFCHRDQPHLGMGRPL